MRDTKNKVRMKHFNHLEVQDDRRLLVDLRSNGGKAKLRRERSVIRHSQTAEQKIRTKGTLLIKAVSLFETSGRTSRTLGSVHPPRNGFTHVSIQHQQSE